MAGSTTNETMRKLLAEISRQAAIMITLVTAFWFFAQPAAEKFVEGVIKTQSLAEESDVASIRRDVDSLQDKQGLTDRVLERLETQNNNILSTTAETRKLLLDLLLEQKRKDAK